MKNEFRINVRVKGIMANHINTMIGGLYENQSEYIRDLIRNDMLKYSSYDLEESLRKGCEQLVSKEYDDQPFDEIVDLIKKDYTAN
mgnify:CR=1 FL=1